MEKKLKIICRKETGGCGYYGINWKKLKATKNTIGDRMKCPKCKKVDDFFELNILK